MKYTLDLTSNNLTYRSGDSLLISFTKPFLNVQSIDSISFDFIPLDTLENGHNIDVRWSFDTNQLDRAVGKPQINWSAWESFSKDTVINPDLDKIYQKILSKDGSFDIEFRIVRRGSEVSTRTIKRVVLDITHKSATEVPDGSLVPSSESCSAKSCVTPNFSSGIILKADPNTLFRPYDVMGPGIQLWKDLSCAVSEMFGHCVRYIKTQAKLESADTVLKEYSLYEATDVKDIKILIPDNNIPDNAIKFNPFDMDFDEGLEVHIVKEHFERAFGYDDLPEQKDYLYFPLLDRIFEVHSAYLFKEFMGAEAYYKVMLYKWQDKVNVMRENPEIAQYIDDITEDFDEILQPETDKEFIDITKPQQYTTTSVGGYDKVRSDINQNLVIEAKDLTNYFTVVGKYFYDLDKNMNWGDLAVKYKLGIDRKSNESTAFTMWFKTTKSTFLRSPEISDILLEGYSDVAKKGYRIEINYEAGPTLNSAVATGITVYVNELVHKFDIPQLEREKWYGLVVNHNNEYSQLSLHIWEMKFNPNQPAQNKTTDLRLLHTSTIDITPSDVIYDGKYSLRGGKVGITNIRIWSENIEEEKQPLLLNQYIVKESRYAMLIDNAIQPLRMVREYVR